MNLYHSVMRAKRPSFHTYAPVFHKTSNIIFAQTRPGGVSFLKPRTHEDNGQPFSRPLNIPADFIDFTKTFSLGIVATPLNTNTPLTTLSL